MGNPWIFISGVAIGIAAVFTSAAVAVELEATTNGKTTLEGKGRLALPEGSGKEKM